MTREEKRKAIDVLKKSAPVFPLKKPEEYNDYIQAINQVIDWLEQEPCDDCVSRKAVLEMAKSYNTDGWDMYTPLVVDVEDIEELPSVTPQSRWIPVSERLPDTDDEVLCWYEYYHWSQEKVLPEYGIGCYYKETSAWYGEVASGRDVRVIAWMPLPQAYSEVKE